MSRWPDQVVKVCGVRTAEHALIAGRAGADFIGMIFAPGRRQITPETGRMIAEALRAEGLAARLVGVFVNERAATITAVAEQVGLDLIQLSGDETPDLLDGLDRPVLKAVRLTDSAAERAWRDAAGAQGSPDSWVPATGGRPAPVRLLVDAHVAGSYGGAGVCADWDQARRLAAELPLLLAGGLDPDTVAKAIVTVAPWGVDVSSGVETDGLKDPAKITAFIAAARESLNGLPISRRF